MVITALSSPLDFSFHGNYHAQMNKKIPPSKLEAHLGFWLRYVSNHVSERFEKLLAAKGTSVTEWVALRTLFEKPETTHAELIAALGMTKGAVSKVVSRLVEKKLIKRSHQKNTTREQILSLTPAGISLIPVLAAEADQNEVHFFGHLAKSEYEALIQTFARLVSHHQLKEIPVT